jgi:hypothetical protein
MECFAAWLYEPATTEWLAKTMGAPFVLWGATALWHWSSRLGAGAWGAGLACLAYMAVDEVAHAGSGTGNDVASGAAFLSCLAFAESARRQADLRAVLLSGLAAGHFAGLKYSNLLYAPLAAAYAGIAVLRPMQEGEIQTRILRSAVVWMLAAFAAGGYWYARNWIHTGNPLFPAEVRVGDWTVLEGPLSRAAMYEGGWTDPDSSLAHRYSATSALFDSSARLVQWRGSLLPLLLAAGALALAATTIQRPRWSTARWTTLVAPPLMLAMFWRWQPYNTQIRYAFAGALLSFAWISLASATLGGRARFLFHLVAFTGLLSLAATRAAGVVDAALTAEAQEPATAALLLGWGIAGGCMLLSSTVLRSRPTGVFLLFGVAVFGWLTIGFSAKTAAALVQPGSSRRGMPAMALSEWDHSVQKGWLELASLPLNKRRRIANVGNGIPYPLGGVDLSQQVVDVAPNGRQGLRLDVYFRRWGPSEAAKRRVRDRFPAYRADLNRDAWLANLRAQNVDAVFITTIHPGERFAYESEMDGEHFPIERRWCEELGFPLLAEGSDFRIYEAPKP